MKRLLVFLALVSNTLYGHASMRQIECQIIPEIHRHSAARSTNWSGYAAVTDLEKPKKKSVSKVAGEWKVPKVRKSSGKTYSSIWIGIDGFGSSSVEQIGTEHDWVDGTQQDFAWFEMFPKGSYRITGFPVKAGDVIQAEVRYEGRGMFKMTLMNKTEGVFTVVPAEYSKAKKASRSSAEWIVEAPSNGTSILPLAHFDKVSFRKCRAKIQGKTGSINHKDWIGEKLVMSKQNMTVKAKPSSLRQDGESFSVEWEHK